MSGQQQPPTPRVDPAVIVIYGEPGQGKSTENVYSWAGRGMFVAQPGALRVANTVVGYDLSKQIVHASHMEQVPDLIYKAKELGFEAVIIDDGSLMMGNTEMVARENFALTRNGKVTGYDFNLYPYMGGVLQRVALAARWCGIHVVINSHEQSAFTDNNGERFLGGPNWAWKKLVKIVPHVACMALRVPKRDMNVPVWDTRCDCDPTDPNYYMKDRFAQAPPKAGPLNTAEILRATGSPVTRPRGLEWMEQVAEGIAGMIVQGAPEEQARAPWKAKLGESRVHPYAIRWALRDGTHRGRLRVYKAQSVLGSL